eukprot:762667-Hanusia_phi.AAC.5
MKSPVAVPAPKAALDHTMGPPFCGTAVTISADSRAMGMLQRTEVAAMPSKANLGPPAEMMPSVPSGPPDTAKYMMPMRLRKLSERLSPQRLPGRLFVNSWERRLVHEVDIDVAAGDGSEMIGVMLASLRPHVRAAQGHGEQGGCCEGSGGERGERGGTSFCCLRMIKMRIESLLESVLLSIVSENSRWETTDGVAISD